MVPPWAKLSDKSDALVVANLTELPHFRRYFLLEMLELANSCRNNFWKKFQLTRIAIKNSNDQIKRVLLVSIFFSRVTWNLYNVQAYNHPRDWVSRHHIGVQLWPPLIETTRTWQQYHGTEWFKKSPQSWRDEGNKPLDNKLVLRIFLGTNRLQLATGRGIQIWTTP